MDSMNGFARAPLTDVTEAARWIDPSLLAVEAPGLEESALLLERQRIAQALHDTLAQMLFTIGLEARWCVDHLQLDERGYRRMHHILHLASRGSDELRTAIYALRSQYLPGSQALVELLQEQVAEFQSRSGVAAALIVPPQFPDLPPLVGEAVYRIVRESLSNVYKHARASAVAVSLHCDERVVVVTVQDDGVGLTMPLSSGKDDGNLHFGVSAMRQFATRAQGEFTIANNEDQGTIVRARFPLPESVTP
jgi:signal transduction histidine kinase